MSRFAKLKAMLAEKGASNPGGLAAAIGRKKYGSKAMKLASKKHISAESAKKELHKK